MKTKEDALRAIAEAEVKIAEAKEILKQEEEIKLEYGKDCYYTSIDKVTKGLGYSPEALEHARYRDTEKQAKKALQREKEANRLEARALKIQSDLCPTAQKLWSIFYSYSHNRYEMWKRYNNREIGAIYMPENTAEQLVEELNSGRYRL